MSLDHGYLLSLSLMREITMKKKTKMKLTIRIIKYPNFKTTNLNQCMHSLSILRLDTSAPSSLKMKMGKKLLKKRTTTPLYNLLI